MKSLLLIFFSILSICCAACDKADLDSRPAAQEELRQLHSAILALAEKTPCIDPAQWAFTALGSKACGGPASYIAYPKNDDIQHFLYLVEQFTEAQQTFNKKYGTISDCMFVIPPLAIRCENDRPILIGP